MITQSIAGCHRDSNLARFLTESADVVLEHVPEGEIVVLLVIHQRPNVKYDRFGIFVVPKNEKQLDHVAHEPLDALSTVRFDVDEVVLDL